MPYVKVKKTSPTKGNPNIHAAFNIKASDGVGVLQIYVTGMEIIKNRGIPIEAEQSVDIFVDPESLNIAFKRNPDSEFKFTKSKNGSFRMSYKDLGKLIGQSLKYSIGTDSDFDLVLVASNQQEQAKSTEKKKGK